MTQPIRALGMMSGTSCDGVDAALITTNGEDVSDRGAGLYRPYSDAEREVLFAAIEAAKSWGPGNVVPAPVAAAETLLTQIHAETVGRLLGDAGLGHSEVDVIGFHGQTILHQPEKRRTVQIGDGALLSRLLDIPVVYDFRSKDVEAGGEGAPFAPLYHAALARSLKADGPVLVVNAGGVGNVTWIGTDGALLAFDTGPANAPIDDWVREHTGKSFDKNGAIALGGVVDEPRIQAALGHGFFARTPPKSLDRLDFTKELARGLSLEDGAATLTAFSAAAIAAAESHFPAPVSRIVVCGGGRHNPAFMQALAARFGMPVESAEAAGWRGDLIEAEAFGFLAVRHLRNLPLSIPTTTGVPAPMSGGRLARPAAA